MIYLPDPSGLTLDDHLRLLWDRFYEKLDAIEIKYTKQRHWLEKDTLRRREDAGSDYTESILDLAGRTGMAFDDLMVAGSKYDIIPNKRPIPITSDRV